MRITKLPSDIMDELKALDIKTVELKWSGGSDEGYLHVETDKKIPNELDQKINKWAWSEEGYNGAGDGSEYGDNITYDLEHGTVSHEEWYHVEKYDGRGSWKIDELPDPKPEIFNTKCGKKFIIPEYYTRYVPVEVHNKKKDEQWPSYFDDLVEYEKLIERYGQPVA